MNSIEWDYTFLPVTRYYISELHIIRKCRLSSLYPCVIKLSIPQKKPSTLMVSIKAMPSAYAEMFFFLINHFNVLFINHTANIWCIFHFFFNSCTKCALSLRKTITLLTIKCLSVSLPMEREERSIQNSLSVLLLGGMTIVVLVWTRQWWILPFRHCLIYFLKVVFSIMHVNVEHHRGVLKCLSYTWISKMKACFKCECQ